MATLCYTNHGALKQPVHTSREHFPIPPYIWHNPAKRIIAPSAPRGTSQHTGLRYAGACQPIKLHAKRTCTAAKRKAAARSKRTGGHGTGQWIQGARVGHPLITGGVARTNNMTQVTTESTYKRSGSSKGDAAHGSIPLQQKAARTVCLPVACLPQTRTASREGNVVHSACCATKEE
jgi:hypothetical protein